MYGLYAAAADSPRSCDEYRRGRGHKGKIHATGLIGSVWLQKSKTDITQEISRRCTRLHCVTGSRAPLDWDQGLPLLCCLNQPCAGFYKLVEEIKHGFLGIKGHRSGWGTVGLQPTSQGEQS